MKLWELVSAFREEEDMLLSVLGREQWRTPYLDYYFAFAQLVAKQQRDVLDAPVPLELSHEVASQSRQTFAYDADTGVLQRLRHRIGPSQMMTTLEVHDRFGGSVIEEVLEFGSASVRVRPT